MIVAAALALQLLTGAVARANIDECIRSAMGRVDDLIATSPRKGLFAKKTVTPEERARGLLEQFQQGKLSHEQTLEVSRELLTHFGKDEERINRAAAELYLESGTHDPELERLFLGRKVTNEHGDSEPALRYARRTREQKTNPQAGPARQELERLTGKSVTLNDAGLVDPGGQRAVFDKMIEPIARARLAPPAGPIPPGSADMFEAAETAHLLQLQNPTLEGFNPREAELIRKYSSAYDQTTAELRGKNLEILGAGTGTERDALVARLRSLGVDVEVHGERVILPAAAHPSRNDDMVRFMLRDHPLDAAERASPTVASIEVSSQSAQASAFSKRLDRAQLEQGRTRFQDEYNKINAGSGHHGTIEEFIDLGMYSEAKNEDNWISVGRIRGSQSQQTTIRARAKELGDEQVYREIYWPKGVHEHNLYAPNGSQFRVAYNRVGKDEYIEAFVNTKINGKDTWTPMYFTKQGEKWVAKTKTLSGQKVPDSCTGCHTTPTGDFSPIPFQKLAGGYHPSPDFSHLDDARVVEQLQTADQRARAQAAAGGSLPFAR